MITEYLSFFLTKAKRKITYLRNYYKLLHQVVKQKGYLGSYVILKHCEFVRIGKRVKINEQVRIECYPEYLGVSLHPELIIEHDSIIGPNFTAFIADRVVVGEGCIFAGNVTLVSENHGISPRNSDYYQREPLQTGPISIGKGCWLGQNVTVLPNTNIGERCIVATNAVVKGNIPPYSMVAGIPGRIIKQYNHETNSWQRV